MSYRRDLFRRDHTGIQNLLLVVDVVNEGVERVRTLAVSSRARAASIHRAAVRRHDVERDQTLGAFVLAVHGEGDADAMEQGVGLGLRFCAKRSDGWSLNHWA